MEEKNLVVTLQLNSGMTIMGTVLDYAEEDYIIHYPFEINLDYDATGMGKMYMVRWLPYNDSDIVMVMFKNVEALVVCSEKYTQLYHKRVNMLKQAINETDDELFEEVDEDPTAFVSSGNNTKH